MSAEGGDAAPRNLRAAVALCSAAALAAYLRRLEMLPTALVTVAVTLALIEVSVAQLVGLVLAPHMKMSRFERDRAHIRAVALQVVAFLTAVLIFIVVSSLPDSSSHSIVMIKLLGTGALVGIWVLATVRVTRYCGRRGGLVAAFGLADDVRQALAILPGRPTVERAARAVLQTLLLLLVLATVASTADAHEWIVSRERKKQTEAPPSAAPGESTSPSPSPQLRSNPLADKRCGYNVAGKIAAGVPAQVGKSLARVLINPDEDVDVNAPGVVEAGCPDEGSRPAHNVYVTPLFHWDSGVRLGLLVSDKNGNAAVVFPDLRAQVDRLVDDERLVRVSRRVRTALGDLQILFIDGEGCAVAVREYNREYDILSRDAVTQLMRLVVERREVPRLLRPLPGKRTTHVFEFTRTRPRTVTVSGSDEVTRLAGTAAVAIPTSPAPCVDAVPFLDVARAEEPAPETTP